jgi:aminoglycoside phosphotransferase (APT) family kinase protein
MLDARVSHGDLHFGNVLVCYKQKEMFVLLHDFGTSQRRCMHAGDYLDDIGKLMDAISRTGKLSSEVNEVLELLEESAACYIGDVHLVQKHVCEIFRAGRFLLLTVAHRGKPEQIVKFRGSPLFLISS